MEQQRQAVGGWLIPVGLAVLVVGMVAIALVRGPVQLDPDSPEGTVQEYLTAINDERWDDAVAVIHPRWLGACEGADLEIFSPPTDFSARLGRDPNQFEMIDRGFEKVEPPPGEEPLPVGETTVEVTITRQDAEFGGGWDEYVLFELLEEDDFWWLTNDPWPYFVWSCRDQ